MIYVADAEANGLVPDKFYCLCYQAVGSDEIVTLNTHEQMRQWLTQPDLIIVMHNGARWDIPNLSRVLGIKFSGRIIDSLFLSWYLSPERVMHGLESYGVEYGVPKPVITDWDNQTQEEYEHRCQEDVKINMRLWKNQRAYMSALYTTDKEEVHNLPIMHYLEFKAKCAALQEKSKWKVNITAVKELLTTLYAAKKEKEDGLRLEMPKVDKRV